ncbi:hypothetical protein VKT23_015936 [Stygiomarasmius scandens]|uniref:Uncharacterized protein n=1 Tax=Marasmiellus scandens TaxID=2682957 RepID=A0ABR1J0U4_9AGAR
MDMTYLFVYPYLPSLSIRHTRVTPLQQYYYSCHRVLLRILAYLPTTRQVRRRRLLLYHWQCLSACLSLSTCCMSEFYALDGRIIYPKPKREKREKNESLNVRTLIRMLQFNPTSKSAVAKTRHT